MKTVRCLAHVGSTFSEVGASGKPGAVHKLTMLGYDVKILQRDLGGDGIGRIADFEVQGFGRLDVYSPEILKPRSISSAIEKKLGHQADTVMVQLPKNYSNVDMYSVAVRTLMKPNVPQNSLLLFQKGSEVYQFNRSMVLDLIGRR
ncbi:hypothetical protein [Agrobacterium sp. T29]|uniref:hypothetical protein n=1 Tax=Agrobacterium sp. T29 TaxID=2580515 RepID=UPI00115E30C0|nr:hypothetical protein [Agrobacterium sp. T29]